MKNHRIEWIDIARGIAILFVIIGHSLGNYFSSYFSNLIYVFHMPIFFVLSGYLYKEKKKSKFLKNSFFNLIMPYIGTVLIAFVLFTIYKFHNNPIVAPSRVNTYEQLSVSALYGIGASAKLPLINYSIIPIGAIWFLLAFFIGTQLFNIIMTLKFNSNDLLMKGIIISCFTFLGTYLQTYIYLPWSINAAFFSQIFFFAGYLLKKKSILRAKSKIAILVATMIWLMTATIGLFGLDNLQFPNMYLAIVGGCASSYLVIKLSMLLDDFWKLKSLKKVLCFFGAESLCIFCFHLIDLDFIQIWPRVLNHVLQLSDSYFLAIVAGIVYRIFFAAIATLIVKYIPIVRSFYIHRKYNFIKNKI